MTDSIETKPYRINRGQMARLTAEYYVRTFWPVLFGVPLFGVFLLITGYSPLLRYFGMVCVLWPLTIPARAVLLTGKAARLHGQETVLKVDEDRLLFERTSEAGHGFFLRRESVRAVKRFQGFVVLQLRKFGFVPVPESAFEKQKLIQFLELWGTEGKPRRLK